MNDRQGKKQLAASIRATGHMLPVCNGQASGVICVGEKYRIKTNQNNGAMLT